MTVKEYLKKVCDYEQEVFERKGKIKKHEEAITRVKNEVIAKNEELQKKLTEYNNQYKQQVKDYKYYKNKEPETLKMPVIILLVILAITMAFHLLVRHFIVNVASATTIGEALPTLLIANLIPAILIGILIYLYFDLYSFKQVLIAILLCLIGLVVVAAVYLGIFVNNGKSMGLAIIIAMIFFMIIELIVGIIVCCIKHNENEENAVKYKRLSRKAYNDSQSQLKQIEEHKDKIARYAEQSKRTLALMEADLAKEKKELANKQDYLKQLYAQNVVHPKYQYWVAVATFYEYLDTKIRYQLEGPQGAYDLYETELRAKKIMDSLEGIRSTITYHGNRIYESQHYIRSQLMSVNSKLDDIVVDTYNF